VAVAVVVELEPDIQAGLVALVVVVMVRAVRSVKMVGRIWAVVEVAVAGRQHPQAATAALAL
jgi:uncharacterized protein with PhoU and TrkA domain